MSKEYQLTPEKPIVYEPYEKLYYNIIIETYNQRSFEFNDSRNAYVCPAYTGESLDKDNFSVYVIYQQLDSSGIYEGMSFDSSFTTKYLDSDEWDFYIPVPSVVGTEDIDIKVIFSDHNITLHPVRLASHPDFLTLSTANPTVLDVPDIPDTPDIQPSNSPLWYIHGEYTGPDVKIGDQYNIDHVKFTVTRKDGTKYVVDNNDLIYDSSVDGMTIKGPLFDETPFYYIDPVSGKTYGDLVYIHSQPYLAAITVEYIGEDKHIGDTVIKSDLKVIGHYSNSITPLRSYSEERILSISEWEIVSNPVITLENTTITVQAELCTTDIIGSSPCYIDSGETADDVYNEGILIYKYKYYNSNESIDIPFIDMTNRVIDIKVYYNGPIVPLTGSYFLEDISYEIYYGDGSVDSFNNEIEGEHWKSENWRSAYYFPENPEYYASQLKVIGSNKPIFYYQEEETGTFFTAEADIPACRGLLSIEAEVLNNNFIVGDRISKEQVKVTGKYVTSLTGTGEFIGNLERPGDEKLKYVYEYIVLEDDEWDFIDIPIITFDNNGIIYIQVEENTNQEQKDHNFDILKTTFIAIEYEIPKDYFQLNVWYEGDKIEVGNTYDSDDVVVYLKTINTPDKVRINTDNCTISSLIVENEGWNWYTCTYSNGYVTTEQMFPVFGYIPKEYPDINFKVLYIDKDTKEKTDYTEQFEEYLTFEGKVSISWKLFLDKANELKKYGLYLLTAPKGTGLLNKYDSEWEVFCTDDTTLKATIIFCYEEEIDGP